MWFFPKQLPQSWKHMDVQDAFDCCSIIIFLQAQTLFQHDDAHVYIATLMKTWLECKVGVKELERPTQNPDSDSDSRPLNTSEMNCTPDISTLRLWL